MAISFTIDGNKINGNLVDFPVALRIQPVFNFVTGNDYSNLHVTVSGGTECYVEVDRWDIVENKAVIWTKIPWIPCGSNVEISLEIGAANPTYVGTVGSAVAENVWNPNYQAVYHMSQSPTGSVLDSTSNSYDLTPYGSMTNSDKVSADFGTEIQFDGIDDRLENTSLRIQFKNSTFVKVYTPDTTSHLFNQGDNAVGSNQGISLDLNVGGSNLYWFNSPTYRYWTGPAGAVSDSNIVCYSANAGTVGGEIYWNVNGTNQIDTIGLGQEYEDISIYPFKIGAHKGISLDYKEQNIDEMIIMSTDASNAWVDASYHNLNDSLMGGSSLSSSSSSSFSSSSFSSSSESSSSISSSSSLSSSSSTSSSSKSSSSTVTSERIHFWHYVLNEGGQPIQNAEIRLYLQSSPTTEADIYTSPIAVTSTTCSLADIKTDNDGYFEFWLEGEGGEGGYAHTTEFILEWYKAGTAPGYIYNYNPWPNALVWRDTNIGADVNYENKFISNYLANKWFGHANAIVPSASPHDLHPVDYESGCDDNTYNKVVSNKFLFDIRVGCAAGDTFNLTSIYDGVQEYQKVVSAGNLIPSGSLFYKDINHSNITGDTVVKMVKIDGYEEIVPALVERLSSTVTRVAIDDNIEAWVTIQGRESSSSSSSESSSSLSSSSSSSLSSSSSSSNSWSSSSWTPNDDFESYADGVVPSGGRWLVKVNDSRDRITNVPTVSASVGTLVWSNVYDGGIYDEEYMFISNWNLPLFTDTPSVTAFEFSLTISGADVWSSINQVNSYGSDFYFGFNDDNTSDWPGSNNYIGLTARATTPTGLKVFKNIDGIEYDSIQLENHFPLELRIRKEVNPANDIQARIGCRYWNRVANAWDTPGTTGSDGWAFGSYVSDTNGRYPYFTFSQTPDVTYLDCEMRNVQVDNFTILEGSIPSANHPS